MTYQPLGTIKSETEKIDNAVVDGLTGVVDSLAYKVNEIEHHAHHVTQCIGSDGAGSAVQDSLVPYVVTAGAIGVEGTEVPIYDGSAMPPAMGVKGDLNRVFVSDVSAVDKIYIVKMYYGPTNFAAAELMTSFYFIGETNQVRGGAVDAGSPRITMGSDKVWATTLCETAGATISFLLERHGYEG